MTHSLTSEEQEFMRYWEANRERKSRPFGSLSRYGILFASLIALFTLVNLATGWHKKAEMVWLADPSIIFVLVLAIVGIIAFMTYFTNRYQFEQYEQRYQELQAKRDGAGGAAVGAENAS
ncbi:MAG TPA: hypothetical protein VHK69_14480 [Chitinophagaceae bacterium]|nr:hypothetical protein [Chitinophagaceae bacterium]